MCPLTNSVSYVIRDFCSFRGLSTVKMCARNPAVQQFIKLNILATLHLLNATRNN